MLDEMVEVSAQKRLELQKKRRLRLKKNEKKIGGKKQIAGKFGAKGQRVGDVESNNGATDFDLESEVDGGNFNISQTSQDMIKGGFDPKIGIKGFIAMMIKAQ